MRGRQLVGSRLNVMSIILRNLFMPVTSVSGSLQCDSYAGMPSNTMTLSAM